MRHVPPPYQLEQEAGRDVVDVLGQLSNRLSPYRS